MYREVENNFEYIVIKNYIIKYFLLYNILNIIISDCVINYLNIYC